MVRKNRIAGLALCLCLLCACGQQPTGEELPPPPDNRPVHGGILTDVGQAETLQQYYGRTAIIGRNERIQGDFLATGAWAEEFARLEYPDAEVSVDFAGGFVVPEGMFRDQLSAGATTWDVAVTLSDGSAAAHRVQVLHFTERTEGEVHQCLSGLLTDGQILTRRPEAYSYLMLDTRYANRMQKLPALELPPDTLAREITDGDMEAINCSVYMLSESAGAALIHDRDGQAGLLFFDMEDSFPREYFPLEGRWNYFDLEEGVLILEQYADSGDRSQLRVSLEDGRPVMGSAIRADGSDRYPVGDYTVTDRDGTLYLGEEILLEGGAWDLDDVTAIQRYHFQQALDDHRFLYSLAGWEWIEGCGIYDLETRTDSPMLGSEYGWGFSMPILRPGVGLALCAHLTEPGWWGFSMMDLTTMENTPLPLGHETEEEALGSQLQANSDLSRLMAVQSDEETAGMHRILVLDTRTGEQLFRWDIPQTLIGHPQIQLVGDDALFVFCDRKDTDTHWVYRIDLSQLG